MIKRTNLKMLLVMAVLFVGMASAVAAGATIYVDTGATGSNDGSSWANAYNYLQDALAVAVASDEIWVAEGTYKPDEDEAANVTPNDRTETFQLITGVAIYGGFAGGENSLDERDWQTNEAILSGDINTPGDNSDNSYHVVRGNGTDATAVLDGFTITAGNADGPYPHYSGGGGLYNYDGSPTVTNCTFSANYAAHSGGGMYNCNWGSSPNPTVTNCTFSGNSAYVGGGMNNGSSNPPVTNCTFSGNSADYGGGMYNYWYSSPTVTNCTFSENSATSSGGGMYSMYGSPTVTNCTFSGNLARSGGGMSNGGSPTLTNCTFSGNSAGEGGGMSNEGYSSPTVTNCTFSGNLARYGGGMSNSGSPTLTNCTFTGNSATSTGGEIGVLLVSNAGGGMYNSGGSVTLSGCTFNANSSDQLGGGIANFGADANSTLLNCIFRGNSAVEYGGGIFNTGLASPSLTTRPILTNCIFSGNTAGRGGGIFTQYNRGPMLTNCSFSENSASLDGGGIYSRFPGIPSLSNCILWGNSDSGGTDESAQVEAETELPDVDYCCIQGWTGMLGGTGNIGDDPLFKDADGLDNIVGTEDDNLRLSYGSPCIDAGDNTAVPADTADLDGDGNTTELIPLDLDNYRRFEDFPPPGGTGVAAPGYPDIVDMGAYEQHLIIYVDNDVSAGGDGTSWATAYKYLQDALAVAVADDDIWVAAGTYKPDEDEAANVDPNDRTETFQLINGVAIYGGFAATETTLDERNWRTNETILSGDINTPGDNLDNSYHVVTGSGTDATAVLDGFTITAGNANGSYPRWLGGGMYNYSSGSPTVTNCTFSGNLATEWGGGMYNGDHSDPRVTNCTFIGNSAFYDGGGMFNWYSSNPTVTNCTFSGNSAGDCGGGMDNWGSSPTITNCTFSGNSANRGGGGMKNSGSNHNIINCTFSGNSAGLYGGGMYNYWSSPTVTNCTFSGNSAGQGGGSGGGMYNEYYSSPTLANCILWGNTAPIGAQIYNDGTSSTTVTYSDVEGGGGGTNIDADPCFVDANGPDGEIGTEDDNLRLSPGSPCIDAGDNNSVPEDANDLDNDGNTVEPIPWDLDGRDRFADGDCNDTEIVDMGAYEFTYAYLGDFDGSCDVDFVDFSVLGLTWLLEEQEAGYDPNCDISLPADGVIDEKDFKIFTGNWLMGVE